MKTASGFSWETFFKIVAGNDRRRSLPQTVMPESLLEPSEGPLLEPLHEPCSPGFEGCRATGQTSKLAPGSTKVPDLQRAESSSVLELQGCRIQRRQGSKVTRFLESKVAGFQGFRASKFQGSGVTGLQNRNPLLEVLQESLAGNFPDAIAKLADSV